MILCSGCLLERFSSTDTICPFCSETLQIRKCQVEKDRFEESNNVVTCYAPDCFFRGTKKQFFNHAKEKHGLEA